MRILCRALAAFDTLLIGSRVDSSQTNSSARFATLTRLNETTHDHMLAHPYGAFETDTVASVSDSFFKVNETTAEEASVKDHWSEARFIERLAEIMESAVRKIGHGVATAAEGAVRSDSPMYMATDVEGTVRSDSPMDIAATYEGVVHRESPMAVAATAEGAVHSESPMDLEPTLEDYLLSVRPMDIATEPFQGVFMSLETLDRTEVFWDIARCEGSIDASALRDVLQRYGFRPPPKKRYAQMMTNEVVDTTDKVVGTRDKADDTTGKVVDATSKIGDATGNMDHTTGKVVGDVTTKFVDTNGIVVDSIGELIGAMLMVRSPVDVTQALMSLHTFDDMKGEASVLIRNLLSRFMRRPEVFTCMWMALGLRPEAVFRAFGFDWDKLDRISLTFLDKLMEYIGLFKEVHPSTSSADDTATLLFNFNDKKGLVAHLLDIAEQPGHDALSGSLRKLHSEVEDRRRSAKREYLGPAIRRHLSRESPLILDDHFWSFAGLRGPINVTALKKFLEKNSADLINRISEITIIKALLLTTGPIDVAQALVSLYDSNLGKQDAIGLSKSLLSHFYLQPGITARLWMELGLDPKKIYEMLSLRPAERNKIRLRQVSEWFIYIELYRAVHPKSAIGPKEAANLFVLDEGTEGLDAWVKRFENIRTYKGLADTLRNIYEERLTKEANTRHANMET